MSRLHIRKAVATLPAYVPGARPAGPDTPAWWTCEWDQCRILAWRDRDCTGALATRRQRP